MNIDTFYFKKDIVNSREAFNELEKIRLKAKPTKKDLINGALNIKLDGSPGIPCGPCGLFGCTDLLAELGILRTRAGD